MAGGFVDKLKNGILSHDVGIDLGTANILVYVKDRGIVHREAWSRGTSHDRQNARKP